MEEIVLVSDNHGQRKPVFRVSHHGFLELSI